VLAAGVGEREDGLVACPVQAGSARLRHQRATSIVTACRRVSSGLGSGGRAGRVVKQLGFELGDPPVGEADVGAGGLESLL
jgi:predicted xylose isomerase-like sugar epimerase